MNNMTYSDEKSAKLVSICVPVYNVAPFVETCVRSLFEQTYARVEYIFVDDCSTDDSMTILRAVAADYLERQPFIHCLTNDRNRGLAYTRRRSIEEAKGEFILCVDSDDWLDVQMVEKMMEKVHQADIVECGFIRHTGSHEQTVMPVAVASFEDVLRDRPYNCIWGKLFRRSLFDDSCFAPEGMNFMEDRHVLTRLRYRVGKVALLNEPLYHYRYQREGSVATGKTAVHFRCMQLFYERLTDWLRQECVWEQYAEVVNEQMVHDKASLMLHCLDMATRRRFADLFRSEETRHMHTLRRSKRLVAFLVHHHLWLLLRLLY